MSHVEPKWWLGGSQNGCNSWGYCVDAEFWKSNKNHDYGKKAYDGDIICIEVNRDTGTLKVYVNGEDQGIADEDAMLQSKELFFAVTLKGEGEGIEILE